MDAALTVICFLIGMAVFGLLLAIADPYYDVNSVKTTYIRFADSKDKRDQANIAPKAVLDDIDTNPIYDSTKSKERS